MPTTLSVGQSVPPNTAHAVSVSLPSWNATVGYEKGEEWVVNSMTTGYPRFFVHKSIQALAKEVVRRFGGSEDTAMLFPSVKTASRCQQFIISKIPENEARTVRIVNLVMCPRLDIQDSSHIISRLSCVIHPSRYSKIAKQVWQHSGDGISSRRSEFCLGALNDGYLVEEKQGETGTTKAPIIQKGPKRYQRTEGCSGNGSTPRGGGSAQQTEATASGKEEFNQFIEERFGRNLSTSHANNAKLAVRRRIAGSLSADGELNDALSAPSTDSRILGLTEDHVYLYPTGMSSIFNVHQTLLRVRGPMKSICFGFPYVDTLKILQKWGPGAQFYGHCSNEELDDLERRLESGERYLALFTEFPGNPLLRSPDLERIHALSKKYDFAVVVDESVGNFINVNVLPYADVVVSSLTKVFSGDSNVMGGSAVLNPHGQYYEKLRAEFDKEYEDNYWAEDAVFLERNSRDFVSRIERINKSTDALTSLLNASPLVKEVYYPRYSPTKALYDKCRNPNGGYGGLFSVTFHSTEAATAFFDTLEVMKGPSLGTNFTLSSPYTILAHYDELEWAKSLGVPSDLVRISVGLEENKDLEARIETALEAIRKLQG